jgi:hypothetical protein
MIAIVAVRIGNLLDGRPHLSWNAYRRSQGANSNRSLAYMPTFHAGGNRDFRRNRAFFPHFVQFARPGHLYELANV